MLVLQCHHQQFSFFTILGVDVCDLQMVSFNLQLKPVQLILLLCLTFTGFCSQPVSEFTPSSLNW
jgi:hypothetical protein